jgi:hypothetical protein
MARLSSTKKKGEISAATKNYRLIKFHFLGEKLNYICSKVDDKADDDNERDDYVDYVKYGGNDDDDNDDDDDATLDSVQKARGVSSFLSVSR